MRGGDKSLHNWDYLLYWNNIRENGFTRIATKKDLKPIDADAVPTVADATWKVEVKGESYEWNEAVKSPVGGFYYVSSAAAADTVRLTYTLTDPSSVKRFINGEATISFPMAYDAEKGTWSTTATKAAIVSGTKTDTPKVQLGVVAQRYPWNGYLDINYRIVYANAAQIFLVTFKANDSVLGAAEARGCSTGVVSVDLNAIEDFKNKRLENVKVTATIEEMDE